MADRQPAGIGNRFGVWLAGGGFKGGTVYGATDKFGFRATGHPTSVHDLPATMLHALGLDHERLTDVHGHVIREILT